MKIRANHCVFQIKLGVNYATVLCAKSFSIDRTVTTKETTTREDGTYKSFDYKDKSYAIDLTTVLFIQDGTNPVHFDFAEYQDNFLPVEFRAIYRDEADNIKIFRGTAIIESCSDVAEAGQFAQGSIHLIGTGKYYQENILESDYANITITSTGNLAAIGLIKFRLIDSNGEIAFDSGLLPEASGGNLSHPFTVTGKVPKGTYYIFWQADTSGIANTFETDAPPTANVVFIDNIQSGNTFPDTVYDFTADRTVTFTLGSEVPIITCVPVFVSGTPILPSGVEGIYWIANIVLEGSQPFNLTDINKPSWMNLEITDGNKVVASGVPDDRGTDIPLEFSANNACGTTFYTDVFTIGTNPDISDISWSISKSGSPPDGTLRVYINSTLSFISPTTSSGLFHANVGDVIQCVVTGLPAVTQKYLKVEDNTTVLHETTTSINNTYTFTVVSGKTYTITGIISVT